MTLFSYTVRTIYERTSLSSYIAIFEHMGLSSYIAIPECMGFICLYNTRVHWLIQLYSNFRVHGLYLVIQLGQYLSGWTSSNL